jgi:hypothetical protein
MTAVTPSGRFGRHRLLLAALTTTLAAGCGGSSAAPRAHATPTRTDVASFTTSAPTVRPSGSLPPEAPAKPGGKYYAIFLAVAKSVNDPSLLSAQEQAKQIGYSGGVGDINCTPGAREALNLAGTADYTAFSIFFATNQQAQDFLNAYKGKVVGTAYITAGCLD